MSENHKGEGSEHTGEAEDSIAGLADDRLYRSIAARPRRRLLSYLLDSDEATVEELAEVLVGWDMTESGGMATTEEYERVVALLRHSHLPTLAEANLVTYDPGDGTVTVGEIAESVRDLLERSIAAEQS
jgi:DNA-binding transcriptional ArsR family regulator